MLFLSLSSRCLENFSQRLLRWSSSLSLPRRVQVTLKRALDRICDAMSGQIAMFCCPYYYGTSSNTGQSYWSSFYAKSFQTSLGLLHFLERLRKAKSSLRFTGWETPFKYNFGQGYYYLPIPASQFLAELPITNLGNFSSTSGNQVLPLSTGGRGRWIDSTDPLL